MWLRILNTKVFVGWFKMSSHNNLSISVWDATCLDYMKSNNNNNENNNNNDNKTVPFPQRKLSLLHMAMLLLVESDWAAVQENKSVRVKKWAGANSKSCDTSFTQQPTYNIFRWRTWKNVERVCVCVDISFETNLIHALQHCHYYAILRLLLQPLVWEKAATATDVTLTSQRAEKQLNYIIYI